MEYKVIKNEIIVIIPAANYHQYRFKTRESNVQFGKSFSTRENTFNECVYLEWQIGYDTIIGDVEKGNKHTKLNKLTFQGANGKTKYPYELSEIVYEAIVTGIIPIEKIKKLLDEITKYEEFIDDKKIEIEHNSKIVINGINFEETSIKLPTLFMVETTDNTQIEVSIQKQQYAAGVQPMLYFCIPLKSFRNYNSILGRTSVSGDKLEYVINTNNAGILYDMLKIFAMCSKRHNHDIAEILKILIKLNR